MTDELPGSADAQRKTKFFISYSRVDLEFAKRIVAALEERRFEVLIDVSSIEPSEKWWQRIKQMIRGRSLRCRIWSQSGHSGHRIE